MLIGVVFVVWAFGTFVLLGGSNDLIQRDKNLKKARKGGIKMNDLKTVKGVKITGEMIRPNKVLGASINVYLKDRVNDQAAFFFKVTGCNTFQGVKYLDGHDDECFNLRIEVEDIDFITIR